MASALLPFVPLDPHLRAAQPRVQARLDQHRPSAHRAPAETSFNPTDGAPLGSLSWGPRWLAKTLTWECDTAGDWYSTLAALVIAAGIPTFISGLTAALVHAPLSGHVLLGIFLGTALCIRVGVGALLVRTDFYGRASDKDLEWINGVLEKHPEWLQQVAGWVEVSQEPRGIELALLIWACRTLSEARRADDKLNAELKKQNAWDIAERLFAQASAPLSSKDIQRLVDEALRQREGEERRSLLRAGPLGPALDERALRRTLNQAPTTEAPARARL